LFLILTSAWICGSSPVHATQGLSIYSLIYNNGDVRTLVPLNLYVNIVNNDSIGHYYTLLVSLEGSYQYTVSGYVNADSPQQVILYILPSQTGQRQIEVTLSQDSPVTRTDTANGTVNVGEGPLLSSYWNLNDEVNSLKTEVSGLQDLTNRLTYALTISITIAVVIAIISLGIIARRRYHEQHDVTLYQKQ